MWVKGIGLAVVLLMVISVKSSYSGRVMAFLAVSALLLYLGLGGFKKR